MTSTWSYCYHSRYISSFSFRMHYTYKLHNETWYWSVSAKYMPTDIKLWQVIQNHLKLWWFSLLMHICCPGSRWCVWKQCCRSPVDFLNKRPEIWKACPCHDASWFKPYAKTKIFRQNMDMQMYYFDYFSFLLFAFLRWSLWYWLNSVYFNSFKLNSSLYSDTLVQYKTIIHTNNDIKNIRKNSKLHIQHNVFHEIYRSHFMWCTINNHHEVCINSTISISLPSKFVICQCSSLNVISD